MKTRFIPLCEHCGRPNQVELPDYRFCSIHCRQLHQQFLVAAGYTATGQPTYLDYALTEADYLARYLVALAKRAAQLLEATEEAEDDEQLRQLTDFMEQVAQGNTVAEKIERLTRHTAIVLVN